MLNLTATGRFFEMLCPSDFSGILNFNPKSNKQNWGSSSEKQVKAFNFHSAIQTEPYISVAAVKRNLIHFSTYIISALADRSRLESFFKFQFLII